MPSKIAGHVLDNNGRPVRTVKISLKGKVIAESGDDGFFSVTIAKPEPRVPLTFTAHGYVTNTRVYNARASSDTNVIVIWPIAYQVQFDPSRDLDIELGGAHIQIPANAFTNSTGTKPGSRAGLKFTWFDVTNQLQRAAAPGDFSGQLLDGSIRRLNSYGIFDFDLQDLPGRSLNLRKGASIGLAINVPRILTERAPKQVGFFGFDSPSGLWKQTGNFDFSPKTLTYNGSVTRFSGAYNLDDPQDTTCVKVQILRQGDSFPMPNATVIAHGLQYDSYGTTNASGFTCLLVQRNASFTVNAFVTVGNSDYATPIQPAFASPDFSSDTGDCGDPTLCPLVGTLYVDLVPGVGSPFRLRELSAVVSR